MRIDHLINGQSVPGQAYFETVKPATQAVLAEVAEGGEAQVHAAVAADKAAFPAWAGRPATERAALCRKLGELALEAGIPAGVFNIVHGTDRAAGEPLCRHPDVRAISFTGSTATGQRIVRSAGLKKFSMALGGKSPFVVLDDADFERAPARLNRVRSAVTQEVKVVVGTKARIHAACPAARSGQLRFLGSRTA